MRPATDGSEMLRGLMVMDAARCIAPGRLTSLQSDVPAVRPSNGPTVPSSRRLRSLPGVPVPGSRPAAARAAQRHSV